MNDHHAERGIYDRTHSETSRSYVQWTKGYFAFPPTVTADGRATFVFSINNAQDDPQLIREHQKRAALAAEVERLERLKEEAWQARLRRDAQQREERLARERAEALIGEMAWVRTGGSLRDEYGRRDTVRTEQLREEIRILDEEARLMKLWTDYEARWRVLLASTTPVAFGDVPWPLPSGPETVDDITLEMVQEFLLGSLRVRSNSVTKRDRIRASILRWHPDKVSAILQRVDTDDEKMVQAGINTVFRHLMAMQDSDRQSLDGASYEKSAT